MKIDSVKLVEVDDSLELLQPSRSIEIKTDKGTVISPNRCATSYEFNRKAELPTETTIDNPISVYTKKFTGSDIANLLTTNTEFGKQLSAIERIDRMTEYSILHVSTFQLYESAKEGMTPLQILSQSDNLNKFLRFLINMQYDAKHDLISIPPLNLPQSILKTTYKNVNEAIEKLGKQVLFSIDLRYKDFTNILDYVSSEFAPNLINLVYRKRREVPQHYDHLAKYARQKVGFLMTDVDRVDFDHGDISTMHYMPFLGNDLYAVEIPPMAIPKAGEKKPKNLANLKVLNDEDLTINSLTSNKVSNEKILKQFGDPKNDELELRLSSLEEARHDEKKYKILNALTRMQELKTSTHEFQIMTDHIQERSSKDYVKLKNGFKDKLTAL